MVSSQKSIQEVCEDVQSIRENICEMLSDVPKVTMSSLETRFSNIEEKLGTSDESVESKITVNTSQNGEHSLSNKSSVLSVTNKSLESIETHDEFMIEVANEVDDRQKRKKTLVIHNMEETDNAAEDNRQVTNILNKIVDDEYLVKQQQLNVYRLGKRSPGRNRTIKVHFKSEDFCRNVLQHTRKLSDSNQFNHIVCQPDLTPVQRRHLKLLVEEKKRRNLHAAQRNNEPDCNWIIRRGKLCRRRDLVNSI